MAEIGTEMAGHHVEQPVDPIHRNAQRWPDEAPAVSGNHVAGAHLIGLAGTALKYRCGNAIGILLERLHLMMIIDLRERQRAGIFEQQRLKPELRIIGRRSEEHTSELQSLMRNS